MEYAAMSAYLIVSWSRVRTQKPREHRLSRSLMAMLPTPTTTFPYLPMLTHFFSISTMRLSKTHLYLIYE